VGRMTHAPSPTLGSVVIDVLSLIAVECRASPSAGSP
jgi:hypothetical protein